MTIDIALGDEHDETVPLSVRVPKRIVDRVLVAGSDARCRHRTQAIIHVLEAGLEYIDIQKAKPMRLEKMVGRVEDLAATQLAIMMEVAALAIQAKLISPIDDSAVAERRREILEEL